MLKLAISVDVVTLSRPVDPVAPPSGVNMAAVLVPVLCVLLVILLGLGVFLARRRRRNGYKRKKYG